MSALRLLRLLRVQDAGDLQVQGVSALQVSRDMGAQYRTAFVLAHKLRGAMDRENCLGLQLSGEVEIDGAYFAGHVKPENKKEDRKDRRLAENQSGKRRCVVVMRERKGRALPFVVKHEGDATDMIHDIVERGATVYADEAPSWDILHAHYETKRINHSFAFSDEDACTNQARAISAVCAVPRSASITGLACILPPMLGRWLGEKTTAVSRTGRCSSW